MRARLLPAVALLATAAAAMPSPAAGQLLSRDEALRLAYPGATLTAERLFLTPDQQKAAASSAGVAVPSALVGRYRAVRDGVAQGRAYIDTHTVRTKAETLLISLDASGRVKRIDVTAFLEPEEYLAPDAFLQQYPGRGLGPDLQLQRAIRPVAGATLTVRAVNDAVRRVLAIDAVVGAGGGR
ncbi:MAG: FMN-binding protein [Acidobacteriota bacterium]